MTRRDEPPVSRRERALELECEVLPNGRMLVTGGAVPHVVDLDRAECDCADFHVRQGACKHLLRVRLAQGEAGLLRALGELVTALRHPGLTGAGGGTRLPSN